MKMRQKLCASVFLSATAISGSALAAPFQHVILLSVDGLHEADLTDPATRQYLPNISALASNGISYTNVTGSSPSDSFPGTTALLTGSSPRTSGVFYDDSYSRILTAPGGTAATPRGTEVEFAENVDINLKLLSGGGPTSGRGAYGAGAINTAALPLNCVSGTCATVTPNQYLNTNTIFDVANKAGLITAFSDKHPAAYTIFSGKSGTSITDTYSPEINAQTAIDPAQGGKLVDASTNVNGLTLVTTTSNYRNTEKYDDLKVAATLNRIDGKTGLGDAAQAAPAISYMNFQAVSVTQKLGSNATGIGGISIVNGVEVVNPALQDALSHTDASVGQIVAELKARGQDGNTLVILTSKHGQDPRIGAATQNSSSTIPNALAAAGIKVAQVTQDDVALIYLVDQSQAAAAAAVIQKLGASNGIDTVLPGSQFGSPSTDDRTPDLIVKLLPGFLFDGNTQSTVKRAEHGGLVPDDTNVPLILSGSGLGAGLIGSIVNSNVLTTQVAPTILFELGLDPSQLDGVRLEGTAVLPGTSVPEPASLALLGSMVLGMFGLRRRT